MDVVSVLCRYLPSPRFRSSFSIYFAGFIFCTTVDFLWSSSNKSSITPVRRSSIKEWYVLSSRLTYAPYTADGIPTRKISVSSPNSRYIDSAIPSFFPEASFLFPTILLVIKYSWFSLSLSSVFFTISLTKKWYPASSNSYFCPLPSFSGSICLFSPVLVSARSFPSFICIYASSFLLISTLYITPNKKPLEFYPVFNTFFTFHAFSFIFSSICTNYVSMILVLFL